MIHALALRMKALKSLGFSFSNLMFLLKKNHCLFTISESLHESSFGIENESLKSWLFIPFSKASTIILTVPIVFIVQAKRAKYELCRTAREHCNWEVVQEDLYGARHPGPLQ